MRLKVVHGFKAPEEIIVRTSRHYWEKNQANLGMSIFRRTESKQKESIVPLPPGALYIGNLSFGRWTYANSGERIWKFHKPYRHYTHVFGWLDFLPNYEFYKRQKIHLENEQPFYGLNNEFGKEGEISQKAFKEKVSITENEKLRFKDFISKFIRVPKWSRPREVKENE